jgi:protoporphyrinogen/coproporphyrinogen III oxidase
MSSIPQQGPRRIVVVGAGLSGLAAAWRLERAGAEVTVLEQRAEPGGRVRTETVGDYLVDTGPDAATQGYERWLALIDDLGLRDRVAPTSTVIGSLRGGRVIDIDPAKTLAAAFTPVLSWRAKARLAAGAVRLRRTLTEVDTYELSRSAALDDPGVNADTFARRYFGAEVTDYLIDGAMRLTTGSGAREASCLGVLGALSGWSVPTVNLRGGLQAVPDGLAAGLADVRFEHTVTSVEERKDGVAVSATDAAGTTHEFAADGCVIASMFHTAREIWPTLDRLAPDFGPRLRDVKLISISLGFAVLPASAAYIITVPTVEDPDLLLIFLQHNKAPDRAPAGHSLITLYTDTLATPRYLERSDEQLVDWAAEKMVRLWPELARHQDMSCVTRWPKGGYLADPGFWRRASELQRALPADGRVALAGDLFGAGSMESSVRWGERAADRILAAAATPRTPLAPPAPTAPLATPAPTTPTAPTAAPRRAAEVW